MRDERPQPREDLLGRGALGGGLVLVLARGGDRHAWQEARDVRDGLREDVVGGGEQRATVHRIPATVVGDAAEHVQHAHRIFGLLKHCDELRAVARAHRFHALCHASAL